MKTAIFLFFVLVMYASIAKAGLPPTTAAGQNQSNTTTFNFKVPNNLATNIGGGTLLESGNNNILVNPSFEHVTFNTGWTTSGGSAIEETSVLVHGRKAMIFVASNTVSIRQDSLLYTGANQFPLGGVQGLASIRINTTVAGLRVCPRQAGAINTSLCVSVVNDGRWGLYKVPFILGGTSNGIEISSTSSVSGNIYVDDAFVGAVDLKVDVPVVKSQYANLESTATFTGNVAITGALTNTNGSGLFSYDSGTGIYTALENIDVVMTVACRSSTAIAGNCSIRTSNTTIEDSETMNQAINSLVSAAKTFNIKKGGTFSAQKAISTTSIDRASVSVTATLEINSSVYSSTNADTDWASCGHTTSDFTGFGTVTNIETHCKREGSDLLMRGKFTSGVSTAVIARLNLKLAGTSLTSASSSIIPSAQVAGLYVRGVSSAGNKGGATFIDASLGHIGFGHSATFGNIAVNGNGFNNGDTIAANGEQVVFTARIPISGWTNSNIIIGSFVEVQTAPGISKPKSCTITNAGATNTTVCSASPCTEYYDTCGTASACTRSAAGTYSCVWGNGTWAPSSYVSCFISGGQTINSAAITTPVSDSNGSFTLSPRIFATGGALTDTFFTATCTGVGP